MKNKKLAMFFGRLFIMIVLVSLCSYTTAAKAVAEHPSDKPEIEFVDGVPMPPVVRPLIILSGSDYEIGYQYFQQLIQIFGKSMPAYAYDVESTYKRQKLHRDDYTEEEIAALKGFEDVLKKYAPEWIDILRGEADGARDGGVNVTFQDLLAHYIVFEKVAWPPYSFVFSDPPIEAKSQKPASTCSGFAAWGSRTKDGKLIAAGSGDDWEGNFASTVIVFPKTGNNFIFSPFQVVAFGGHPVHPGMNNKGLVHVHHGSGSCGNEKWGYSLPIGMSIAHTLRFANNTEEALKLHLSYNPGFHNYDCGNFFADVSNDALVLECRDPLKIRTPGYAGETDFIYQTNTRMHKDLGEPGEIYVPHGGYMSPTDPWTLGAWSVSRNLFIWNMLHNYGGSVDVDFFKMMYRYPSKINTPTLEEADAKYETSGGKTYNSVVGSAENGVIGIAVPDNGNNGLYYVARGAVGRQTGPAFPGAHQYPPGRLFTFYQVKLAESPAKVAEAALTQAQKDIQAAYDEVLKHHPVSAPLEVYLMKAKGKIKDGKEYMRDALRSKNDARNAVFDYSKATRCFTAAQAYARYVYEGLVPPATIPDELGLKPWYGDWGDWDRYWEDINK